MRTPITWQSLAAPDLRGVAQMMGQAQNSFNSGFDNFNDVIKDQQKVNNANWENQKVNNTNTLFNKLAGYNSPEEYQAALNSGALQQEAAGYGAQVDQAAFRQALDRRMGDLQQRAVQGVTYNNTMNDSKDAPVLDQISALTAEGKHTEAKALASSLIRNQGKAQGMIRDTARQDIERGYADAAESQKVATRPLEVDKLRSDLLTAGSNRSVNDAQIRELDARAERDLAASRADGKGSGKAADAALEEMIKNGEFSAGTLDEKAGMDNFVKWVNDNVKNNAEKADIIYNFGKTATDGITFKDKDNKQVREPMPVAAAIKAIMASTDSVGFIPGWSRRGDDADNIFRDYLKKNRDSIRTEYDAIEQARNNKIYPPLLARAEKVGNPKEDRASLKDALDTLDEGTAHPMLNNAAWMDKRRKEAMEKNAKLSDEIKRRVGIIK